MKYVKQLAALAALSLAFVPGAKALPILNGEISFGGTIQLKTGGSNAATMAASDTAQFVNPWTVNYATGDYASLMGQTVTFGQTTITTIEGPYSTPISPFWTVVSGGNTYTFDLAGFTVNRTPDGLTHPGQKTIEWSGTGTAYGTGFDPNTSGTWYMGITSAASAQVNFTSQAQTTIAPAVPDGGNVVAAMGLAIIGMAGVRRFRVRA